MKFPCCAQTFLILFCLLRIVPWLCIAMCMYPDNTLATHLVIFLRFRIATHLTHFGGRAYLDYWTIPEFSSVWLSSSINWVTCELAVPLDGQLGAGVRCRCWQQSFNYGERHQLGYLYVPVSTSPLFFWYKQIADWTERYYLFSHQRDRLFDL